MTKRRNEIISAAVETRHPVIVAGGGFALVELAVEQINNTNQGRAQGEKFRVYHTVAISSYRHYMID
jgi:hypothetical protein